MEKKKMEPIENDNFDNKCMEENCGEKYTHSERVVTNKMVVFVLLCDKHAEQWNKNLYKLSKERKKWLSMISKQEN